MRLLPAALGLAAWAWAAALLVIPATLEPFCGVICHQRPERSFFIGGSQLPVCARCTGLYLGAALAFPIGLLAPAPAARRARWILAVTALPTAVTWMLEVAGVAPFSNIVRCAAALPLGAVAAWLVLSAVAAE